MNINFQAITKDNWRECIKLATREDQKHFVASNLYSLCEASYEPGCFPLAIYDVENMVGFVMYGIDDEKQETWIVRLMIDQRYQGKGYGRAALERIVQRLVREHNCPEIFISAEPENEHAIGLYERFGFVKTGDILDGEAVLKLMIRS